jgi:hypothetical protein
VEVEGHPGVVLLDHLPGGLLHGLGADATHGGWRWLPPLLRRRLGAGAVVVVAAARGVGQGFGVGERGELLIGEAGELGLGFRRLQWI